MSIPARCAPAAATRRTRLGFVLAKPAWTASVRLSGLDDGTTYGSEKGMHLFVQSSNDRDLGLICTIG